MASVLDLSSLRPSTGFGERDIAFTGKVVGMKELFEMFNKITSLSILLTSLVWFDFSPSLMRFSRGYWGKREHDYLFQGNKGYFWD